MLIVKMTPHLINLSVVISNANGFLYETGFKERKDFKHKFYAFAMLMLSGVSC